MSTLRQIADKIRASLMPHEPIETTRDRVLGDSNHVGECVSHGRVAHLNHRCPYCLNDVAAIN